MTMQRKLLLLGSSGKMGSAVREVLEGGYALLCKNSRDFDARDSSQVKDLIEAYRPDIVVNAAAFTGIDQCEKAPEEALRINTLYPRLLAELSNEFGFLLVHFSTDAVFNNSKGDYYSESDNPGPLNIYGFTKYGGDCFIRAIAETYYIFRISLLFGNSQRNTQFVERMLQKVVDGETHLRIADDIVSSPSYSHDVAREIKRILECGLPFGLYHVANEGKPSLYELIREIIETIGWDVDIERASHRDFPASGVKNTYTPIRSEKINRLRPWKDAVKEYCDYLSTKKSKGL